MTTTAENRTRLNSIRERTGAARQRMAAAREAIKLAGSDSDARRAAEGALELARGEVELATQLESVLLSQIAGVSTSGFGDSFLDDPNAIRDLESLATSVRPIGSVNLGPLMSAEQLAAQIESGNLGGSPRLAIANPDLPDAARQEVPRGIISQLRRKLRLLDLIPTGTMTGRSFDYTPETGSFDTAFETAEGAVKPEGDTELEDAQVIARTIAHFAKLKRQQLADVPALAVTVQARLVYGVLRRVENQILAGDGIGENLKGILTTAGVADVPYIGGPLADLALDGIVEVLSEEAEPNAVVLNPTDWGAMLKVKAEGSGEYLSEGGPFLMNPDTIWALPTIVSTVMPVGTALVGDFTQGCTMFIREAVNVRISDSDQDDFTRNRCTMLGEGRFGLAVWRPACFAKVALA